MHDMPDSNSNIFFDVMILDCYLELYEYGFS